MASECCNPQIFRFELIRAAQLSNEILCGKHFGLGSRHQAGSNHLVLRQHNTAAAASNQHMADPAKQQQILIFSFSVSHSLPYVTPIACTCCCRSVALQAAWTRPLSLPQWNPHWMTPQKPAQQMSCVLQTSRRCSRQLCLMLHMWRSGALSWWPTSLWGVHWQQRASRRGLQVSLQERLQDSCQKLLAGKLAGQLAGSSAIRQGLPAMRSSRVRGCAWQRLKLPIALL